jgi:hypothetical protein
MLHVGFHPSLSDQQALDAILEPDADATAAASHLGGSWRQRALGVLNEFPRFFGNTLLLCIAPCLFTCAAISVGSWHARRLCSEFPHVTATFENLEDLAEVRSTPSLVAEGASQFITNVSVLLGITLLLCSQVSHHDVLPFMKFSLLPTGVIFVAAPSIRPVVTRFGAFHLLMYTNIAVWASIFIGFLLIVVQIGRRIKDNSFWWKMMTWFFVNLGLTYGVHQMWILVPEWTDLQKALVVMLYAPVVSELALTVGRFVTRGLPERHEAANWVLNGCTQVRPRTPKVSSTRVFTLQDSCPLHRCPYGQERDCPPDPLPHRESTSRPSGSLD